MYYGEDGGEGSLSRSVAEIMCLSDFWGSYAVHLSVFFFILFYFFILFFFIMFWFGFYDFL